ncbi:sulfate ABC transporter ATP-binding protein (plasmid) [Azospirillum sp. TSH58]|uniref:sulfate/molybdate ABC transporter ATP-binding protein n=1 Tax=Azospirillum sp. TSH58 TaxID=664962 RepID=UPI000D600531|nr:sulfate ABC transporter ATP-binding protein [Azospirillum sp. TSH58]AWJ86715.1 sulfate ABC transporter ATP-binding protein [Azospirillum sp. TSH58]PWC64460.1 sulfate ABC transporter ATP-binding protein [Azospirillum sp. TSH58]
MAIQVSGITKQFGSFRALDSVDLEVRSGELLALLGPSGSGKTTLLRIMAGLEFADSGSLLLNGEEALSLTPRERQVGFVFQHYALFRHMTVFENVAFGMKVRPRGQRPTSTEIKRRVMELLDLVQLAHFADRYPAQLSGGQRQRVALARALAIEPKVLLLDEPFGALDAKVRKELRRWLRKLHEDIHITSVFVTHDQEEALELADRVVVMSQGRIEQVGSPADVYDRPASAFVYEFLGQVNRFDCIVADGVARTANGALSIPADGTVRGPAIAYVRPHDLGLSPSAGGPGRVSGIHVVGPDARIEIDLAGLPLEAEMDRERLTALGLRLGDQCTVHIDRARVFPQP